MCQILAFEADRRAFIITINSFGTELTKDDREKLYPTCGKLYPDGLKALARADDYEQVRSVAEYYSVSILALLSGSLLTFLALIAQLRHLSSIVFVYDVKCASNEFLEDYFYFSTVSFFQQLHQYRYLDI